MMLASRSYARWSIAECSCSCSWLPFLYLTRTIARAKYSTDQLNLERKAGEGAAEERRLQDIKHKWSSRRKPASPPSSPSSSSLLPLPDHRVRRQPRRVEDPASQRMQNAMRRPKQLQRSSSIPFEGDTGSGTPAERLQKTTITPREMQIFEELFRKGVSTKKITAEAGTDAAKGPSRPSAAPTPFPELLRPLAEEAQHLRQSSSNKQLVREITSVADLEIKDSQAAAIRDLMDSATTDIECWEVLRDHILHRLRCTPAHVALHINFPALPALLQHYMYLQTEKLPSTHSLGLVALTELRKVGPLAFALGATTDLYNAHMRLLWRQYRDMQSIDDILLEMDREVYEVDATTQNLLGEILDHARDALSGILGESMQALWTMDRKVRGVKKMKEWKKIVDQRLRERALSEAKATEAARAADRREDQVERERRSNTRNAAA